MTLVLIVQNSGQSREDMAATLRAEGYEILEAETAEAGTQLARTAAPEAILLDPRLPNRAGYELYARLRLDRATSAIPVLFLPTQGPTDERREEQMATGGLDMVTRVGVALRTRATLESLRAAGTEINPTALTDALTGLPNRRALESLGPLELAAAQERSAGLATILVDLDGFARVNEAWGFVVGDHALQAFAGLLHTSLRANDVVGRWNGASFLVLLPDTRLDAAWHVAERLRQRIELLGTAFASIGGQEAELLQQQRLEGEAEAEAGAEDEPDEGEDEAPGEAAGEAGKREAPHIVITGSLGVTERTGDDGWEDLLGRAVAALVRAKRAGRNRAEVA
jgi:diguanylate cyclase (GGDEF)-like protein